MKGLQWNQMYFLQFSELVVKTEVTVYISLLYIRIYSCFVFLTAERSNRGFLRFQAVISLNIRKIRRPKY